MAKRRTSLTGRRPASQKPGEQKPCGCMATPIDSHPSANARSTATSPASEISQPQHGDNVQGNRQRVVGIHDDLDPLGRSRRSRRMAPTPLACPKTPMANVLAIAPMPRIKQKNIQQL